jgi:hypothetical protein
VGTWPPKMLDGKIAIVATMDFSIAAIIALCRSLSAQSVIKLRTLAEDLEGRRSGTASVANPRTPRYFPSARQTRRAGACKCYVNEGAFI